MHDRLFSRLHMLAFFCVAVSWAAPAWAVCGPTENLSVASGGTVIITCDTGGFGFEETLSGNPFATPHGSVVKEGVHSDLLDYTNNGDGALSDTFVLTYDGGSPTTTFVVTVGPASSLTINPASLPTPAIGVPYSQQLSTSGGVAPYAYSVASGSLPPGLTLSPSGLISGTPTGAKSYGFTVHVADSTPSTPQTADKGYSVVVPDPVLDISPDNPVAGAVGLPYSVQFSTSGGTAPYGYSIESGSVPTGLTLSSSGLLSGTPTVASNFTFGLKSVDSTTTPGGGIQFPRVQDVTVVINAAPVVVVAPTSVPGATVGTAYATTNITASGGTAPYTFSVSAGALPAGLTLSSAGGLSGTPTAGGTFNFTVNAADSSGAPGPYNGSQAYTLTVAAPAITLPATTLSNGTVGSAYAATLNAATGGTAPYTYAVASGALPAGVTLSGSGALSGTPTAGGTFNFTVTATDSSTGTGPYSSSPRSYSLTIAAPTITLPPTTLADGTRNTAYSATLNPATGGVSPYTYVVTGGALPTGIALSSTGALSGTPAASGTFNFTVTASDHSTGTGPYTADQTYSLRIIDIPPVGNPVSATVAYGSGGNPITLNITGGTPDSVAVATAAAHGTATAAGTSITYTPNAGYHGADSFTYTAENSVGTSLPATVTITVGDPTITVTASGSLTAQAGVAYTQTFTASGGAAPYSLSVSNLPAGLSPVAGSNSITVSGIPTEVGSFNLGVTGVDSSTGPVPISQTFVLNVAAPAIVLSPAAGNLTVPYGASFNQSFSATGGVPSYTLSLSGTLPAGLSFNATTGTLSGTATQPGNYPISVTATDSATGAGAPFSTTSNYTLQVGAPTIAITPAALTDATAGAAYTPITLGASGGVAPYGFSLSSGPLPNGMSITAAGVLSGTPTQSGTFPITVQAQDANGQTGTQNYTLKVLVPSLTVSPASLPAGTAGTAYSQTLSASGGVSPYSYAVTAGALPAGISLTAGTLAGTPTVTGTFNFTVTATDSTGGTPATGIANYALVIAAPTITLAPASLPAGQFDVAYNQTITATGGTASYTYAVTGGALPSGLSLSSAGALSGTPTATGSFNVSITATDNLGFTGMANYTLAIADNPPIANPDTAETLDGQPVTINVTGNDTGVITSIAISTAPSHGTATVNGTAIDYTPGGSFVGSDTLQYTATGPGGTSTPALVTIDIRPVPAAAAQHVTTVSGKAVVVDLTKDATGGPFTGATLVSVPPSSSGTTSLSGYQLTFTPEASFHGTATVTFTLSNAYATSPVTSITIEVVERPDPTLDAEVMGILNAQTAATRRFATSQIGNFQQRLEGLHEDDGQEPTDGLAFVQGMVLSFDSTCGKQQQSATDESCGRKPKADPNWPFKSSLDDTATAGTPGSLGGGGFGHSKVTIWTGGSINIGERDGADGYKFETSGVSAGVDYRFNRDFTAGVGFGYGHDDSDIGDNGSHSTGESYTAGVYASYHPGHNFFIDGLVGYQWLSFDSQRYLTSGGGFATGERDGGQWFASISAGSKFQIEQLQISPYARLDVARATLDAFTESGDPSSALHYGEQDISTTTGNLGLTFNYKYPVSFGVISPQLRLEYQHDFQGDSAITMNYADMFSGPLYHTSIEGLGRDRFMLGLGVNIDTEQDFALRLEYRGMFGSGGDTDNGFLVNLGKKF